MPTVDRAYRNLPSPRPARGNIWFSSGSEGSGASELTAGAAEASPSAQRLPALSPAAIAIEARSSDDSSSHASADFDSRADVKRSTAGSPNSNSPSSPISADQAQAQSPSQTPDNADVASAAGPDEPELSPALRCIVELLWSIVSVDVELVTRLSGAGGASEWPLERFVNFALDKAE